MSLWSWLRGKWRSGTAAHSSTESRSTGPSSPAKAASNVAEPAAVATPAETRPEDPAEALQQLRLPAELPARIELVPGGLRADVYSVKVATQAGTHDCWVYVSEGLDLLGQREIVFVLKCEDEAAPGGYPEDPLHLFITFFSLAGRGQVVGIGDFTQLGARKFFGRHLLYAPVEPIPGVPLPARCIAALLIDDEELALCRSQGTGRLLARLGRATRYYPFPLWSDLERDTVAAAGDTLLSKLAVVEVKPPIWARMANDAVIVTARRGRWQEGFEQLPEGVPFAFATEVDPQANACLVWSPGQDQAEAISPAGSDGSRVAGCFVAFLGEQPRDSARVVEDGFLVMLTPASWQQLRRCVLAGEAMQLPISGASEAFELRWEADVSRN